jgi:hypothetical protein
MITEGFVQDIKWPEREADYSHLVPRIKMHGAVAPVTCKSLVLFCLINEEINFFSNSFCGDLNSKIRIKYDFMKQMLHIHLK